MMLNTQAKWKCEIDTCIKDILILNPQKSNCPLDIIDNGYINIKVHQKGGDKFIFLNIIAIKDGVLFKILE